MQIELVYIPMIFSIVAVAMLSIKPIEVSKVDLSSIFIHWPETYRLVEGGNFTHSHLVCVKTGVPTAPSGLAYRVLDLSCRFKP